MPLTAALTQDTHTCNFVKQISECVAKGLKDMNLAIVINLILLATSFIKQSI